MGKYENMKDISMELTNREGGQVNLAKPQIDEVLAKLSDIIYEDEIEYQGVFQILYDNGERRAKIHGK